MILFLMQSRLDRTRPYSAFPDRTRTQKYLVQISTARLEGGVIKQWKAAVKEIVMKISEREKVKVEMNVKVSLSESYRNGRDTDQRDPM